jgi:hypothetical protein
LIGSINLAATAAASATLQKAFADSATIVVLVPNPALMLLSSAFFGPTSNELAKAVKEGCKNLKEEGTVDGYSSSQTCFGEYGSMYKSPKLLSFLFSLFLLFSLLEFEELCNQQE